MKYVCQICGYVYDEDKEKVKFRDLPEDWRCPLCGAAKSDFKPAEEPKNRDIQKPVQTNTDELKNLNVGELAALCSNLARGCEKQYKPEEAGLFRQLAEYFDSVAPAEDGAKIEEILKALSEDNENYAGVRAVADENNDRGAARVCVWGEKVSRMLESLVNRYIKEGEQMLSGQEVWVCTVCGFVFVGHEPPELCPVCKVPSWKFEKM